MATGYVKGKAFELELAYIEGGLFMAKDAAAAFNAMFAAAKADGIHLKANTAFRDNEHQTRLRNAYDIALKAYNATFPTYLKHLAVWAREGGEKPIKPKKPAPVAPAGFSNHQAGIAVDINRAPGDDPTTVEPDSPIDRWLDANARKFGFKRTVAVESWHWEHDKSLLPVDKSVTV